MKITFNDGSFVEVIESVQDIDSVSLIMCGFKSYNSTTMSASELDRDQALSLANFLFDWAKK